MSLRATRSSKSLMDFLKSSLTKELRGMSCRKYADTVVEAAQAFGVSASSVSRHIIAATAKQLEEFKERSLSAFNPFAIFLDTIHRAGEAFIIGLGIDTSGEKMPLGFWQGGNRKTMNYAKSCYRTWRGGG